MDGGIGAQRPDAKGRGTFGSSFVVQGLLQKHPSVHFMNLARKTQNRVKSSRVRG